MSDIQYTGAGRPVWYPWAVAVVVVPLVTLLAGAWLGRRAAAPKVFDARSYRETNALVLLGTEQKQAGSVWHIGRVGPNGPLDDLTLFVASPTPPVLHGTNSPAK